MAIDGTPMIAPLRTLARGLPVLTLLHPRQETRLLLVLLIAGGLLAAALVSLAGFPLWGGTTVVVGFLLYPAMQKWRADQVRWGTPVMVLSILVALQSFHGIEHVAQAIQYHILGWPPKQSSGLISAANAEWIHFVWNWSVVIVMVYLMIAGRMRNVWAWALLAWSLAHSLEHGYLMQQYLRVLAMLTAEGVSPSAAQGLPGILGSHGWLAEQPRNSPAGFLCTLVPPLATLPRIDIHFSWNVGETLLLWVAAHTYLRQVWRKEASHGAA